MTAELQQDDAAGAADRQGAVGQVAAMGAGGGLRVRREEGCGARAGAARVGGGRAGLRGWARCGGREGHGRAAARLRKGAREEAEVFARLGVQRLSWGR